MILTLILIMDQTYLQFYFRVNQPPIQIRYWGCSLILKMFICNWMASSCRYHHAWIAFALEWNTVIFGTTSGKMEHFDAFIYSLGMRRNISIAAQWRCRTSYFKLISYLIKESSWKNSLEECKKNHFVWGFERNNWCDTHILWIWH